ncbi:hypothetical protein HG536_0B03070 [Torulaspora globosa]|uniref:Fatty acid synthase subunit alpha n=1 Tax=Torulaspora globosa TaxID=48254 RepID=A0A7G3ZD58_9SACH|nr:uncharacterized protein HG536_0B03070 [Torulaspora globosa]QLL31444.1 hypothetical protein HG536_0B03070 [Torulaspora globosa]
MVKEEYKAELATTLLTELLAYQFAFPVRWIETQDHFINEFKAERIIEVGPSPILANMATRTIKANESHELACGRNMKRQVYCTSNHLDKIYYGTEPAAQATALERKKQELDALAQERPHEQPANIVSVATSSTQSTSGTFRFANQVTLCSKHMLTALVSNKLPGCKYADLNLEKSLKELSHGKSTLQNEIKSDLIKEFECLKDDSFEDIPLIQLSSDIEQDTLGPLTLARVIKFVSQSFSGKYQSLNGVRNYLMTKWSVIDPNPVLLFIAYQDSSFKQRFSTETDTEQFINDCCETFARIEKVGVIKADGCLSNSRESFDGSEEQKLISREEYDAFSGGLMILHQQQRNVLDNHLTITKQANDYTRMIRELQVMKQRYSDLEAEFGEYYLNQSIKRLFSPRKVRIYDSAWNWSRQDILLLLHSVPLAGTRKIGVDTFPNIRDILNRVDQTSLKMLQYFIDRKCPNGPWKTYLSKLYKLCQESLNLQPICTDDVGTTLTINRSNGDLTDLHEKEFNSEHYIKNMSLGNHSEAIKCDSSVVSTKLEMDSSSYYKIEGELFRVYSKIIQYALAASSSNPDDLWCQFESLYEQLLIFIKNSDQIASYFRNIVSDALSSINKSLYEKGNDVVIHDYSIECSSDEESDVDILSDESKNEQYHAQTARGLPETTKSSGNDRCAIPVGVIPFLHIKRHSNINEEWIYDKHFTQVFLNNLLKIGSSGLSLTGKTALLLISDVSSKLVSQIIRVLLQAGATVLAAVNEFSYNITQKLQSIYHNFGSKTSKLVVLPLNQASKVDVKEFCGYITSIYEDIDFLLPLNVHESENNITSLSSKEEVTLRSVSVNLLRLFGHLVEAKQSKKMQTRPTFVILPLSPLSGSRGTSGILSESYAFLNKVLEKWQVEGWKESLSFCGCMYGWTDEDKSDPFLTEGLEKLGIRTFSPTETAFNLLGLLTYEIVTQAQSTPLVADLNGGLHNLPNIQPVLQALKSDLIEKGNLEKLLKDEEEQDKYTLLEDEEVFTTEVKPKGNIDLQYPNLLDYSILKEEYNGSQIEGLLDPANLVVVTGFAEVGPWGNSRTRWQIESTGVFSLEGCIEMAWIMGFIKYKQTSEMCGWVDAATFEPVDGIKIKERFEAKILEHSGIRIIEPELFGGYDPSRKQMLQEVIINHDLQPIQTSAEIAEQYKLEQGDKVDVFALNDGQCSVRFLKGASLFVPKALNIERMVAGQIPTGWSPEAYGIPADIVSQVDPTTLFALVSTAEALIASGIVDPYEMYQYVHVSEVGNCIGSGIGGMKSHEAMQVFRMRDEPVQNDIMCETYINVIAAWINMLLISSSGPIKTPVGACATAVESLEMGYETIALGKAKICLVGGVDDFQGTISHEFANMGATSNSTNEAADGREPREMCRPATSTRNGFMESQGAGVQILMRGDLALKMGVPIYGIVGLTATASDKIGKSLPAPGKGILTTAREIQKKPRFGSSKLNLAYRKRQLRRRIQEIECWTESELSIGADPELTHKLASSQLARAKMHWGTDFYKDDPNIAPIRGALSVFGLSIDDLAVASCHGTSTKANEKNESQILDKMMDHLGRAEGNPLIAVFQKHLTGHPKGAAGAWMLNGCLQIMNTGVIPGNKNADNVDNQFETYKHLVYPSRPISMDSVKACCITSFGFGQKGAMALVINPNYLFACLSQEEYQEYALKRAQRERDANSHYNNGLAKGNIVQVKSAPPFSEELEKQFYLDPLARINTSSKYK